MRGERRSVVLRAKVESTIAGGCARLLTAAWLCIAATGCTPWKEYIANGYKVGPNYCTPPAAVAENWIDAADQRIHTDDPDLSRWWTVFDDGELNELIQASYQQNLTLREAGFRILQARAALAVQVGNLFPQSQEAFGLWTRNSLSLLAANQQFLPQQFFDNWDLGFNMAWELDFWGRFRRAIEAADDDLDTSVFNYDDVLVTLLGDVAGTYVRIRTVQQQIEYVRQNIAIQQESLDIAEARYKGGLTSDLDVEQATSQLAQTEALIPQFEIQLRQANNRLCVLLGIPTKDLTKIMSKAPIPSAPPEVVIGIPAQLLTRRPDIRRAEREAAAQCAQIGIAESNLYPRVSITGTVGYDAEHFNQLFNSESFNGNVGPGFQWNVLNYGRLVNTVRLEEARFQELVTRYQNVVLQANADVEDGLVEFLQSQVEARALKTSVDAAQKAVQLAIVQYRGGLVDFNRVALLEQNLVQQQDLYAQAVGDIALGLVRVYRALGGGWEIRCDPSGATLAGGEVMEGEVDPNADAPPPEELPAPQDAQPTAPERKAAPDLKETPPGELIKPSDVPPRSAPTQLPDLGPDVMPDEDVFGPGKPKSEKSKTPSFDEPDPPPDDSIFGPPDRPAAPPADKSKSDDTPKSNSAPMSKRRAPATIPARQAATTKWPNARPLFPGRVQHAGVLPEDRGEVRRWR